MPIIFSNPGLIDLRGIRTFGLSAKEGDNPLGQFGTGAKHGIAILMRTSHKVTLWRGLEKYTFGVRSDKMRDKEFNFITLTGPSGTTEELPYTTDLGKGWEVWQAYRELHSNVIDELGVTYRSDTVTPEANTTMFVVEGEPISQAYNDRSSIFLSNRGEPIITTDTLEVYKGISSYAYYRGVRVYELPRPSLYTYNMRQTIAGLTEDRTLKSSSDLDFYLAHLIARTEDTTYINDVCLASDAAYEASLNSWYAIPPSPPFTAVYSKLREEGKLGQLTVFATKTYLAGHKTLPLPAAAPLSPIQQKQLDKALGFCKAAGYSITDYPVVVIPHAHSNVLALAEGGKIVLTLKLFDMGVKELVNALIEEWVHLKHDLRDETRELQTFLLRQLVNAHEVILGEPL